MNAHKSKCKSQLNPRNEATEALSATSIVEEMTTQRENQNEQNNSDIGKVLEVMETDIVGKTNVTYDQSYPPLPSVDTDATGFIEPKRKRNRYAQPIPTTNPIVISNRFDTLSKITQDNENNINTTKPKIPPIYICEAHNFQSILTDLKKIVTSEFKLQQCFKKIKLQLSSIDDYRKVTEFYNQNDVKYYSFNNPYNKTLSIIIRGVPYGLSNQELLEELSKDYPVSKVTRLMNRERQPTPLLSVVLEDSNAGREIFNLRSLFYSIVKVEERRKSNKVLQCSNCMLTGHSKNYCHLDAKCSKCAGNHKLNNCPQRESPVSKCANCGDNHMASYRGCPVLKHQQEKRHHLTRKPPDKQTLTPQPPTPNQPHYAEPSKPQLKSSNNRTSLINKDHHAQFSNPWTKGSAQTPDPNEKNATSDTLQVILNLIKPFIPLIIPLATQLLTLIIDYGNSN